MAGLSVGTGALIFAWATPTFASLAATSAVLVFAGAVVVVKPTRPVIVVSLIAGVGLVAVGPIVALTQPGDHSGSIPTVLFGAAVLLGSSAALSANLRRQHDH
jgi:hypothetical protein